MMTAQRNSQLTIRNMSAGDSVELEGIRTLYKSAPAYRDLILALYYLNRIDCIRKEGVGTEQEAKELTQAFLSLLPGATKKGFIYSSMVEKMKALNIKMPAMQDDAKSQIQYDSERKKALVKKGEEELLKTNYKSALEFFTKAIELAELDEARNDPAKYSSFYLEYTDIQLLQLKAFAKIHQGNPNSFPQYKTFLLSLFACPPKSPNEDSRLTFLKLTKQKKFIVDVFEFNDMDALLGFAAILDVYLSHRDDMDKEKLHHMQQEFLMYYHNIFSPCLDFEEEPVNATLTDIWILFPVLTSLLNDISRNTLEEQANAVKKCISVCKQHWGPSRAYLEHLFHRILEAREISGGTFDKTWEVLSYIKWFMSLTMQSAPLEINLLWINFIEGIHRRLMIPYHKNDVRMLKLYDEICFSNIEYLRRVANQNRSVTCDLYIVGNQALIKFNSIRRQLSQLIHSANQSSTDEKKLTGQTENVVVSSVDREKEKESIAKLEATFEELKNNGEYIEAIIKVLGASVEIFKDNPEYLELSDKANVLFLDLMISRVANEDDTTEQQKIGITKALKLINEFITKQLEIKDTVRLKKVILAIGNLLLSDYKDQSLILQGFVIAVGAVLLRDEAIGLDNEVTVLLSSLMPHTSNQITSVLKQVQTLSLAPREHKEEGSSDKQKARKKAKREKYKKSLQKRAGSNDDKGDSKADSKNQLEDEESFEGDERPEDGAEQNSATPESSSSAPRATLASSSSSSDAQDANMLQDKKDDSIASSAPSSTYEDEKSFAASGAQATLASPLSKEANSDAANDEQDVVARGFQIDNPAASFVLVETNEEATRNLKSLLAGMEGFSSLAAIQEEDEFNEDPPSDVVAVQSAELSTHEATGVTASGVQSSVLVEQSAASADFSLLETQGDPSAQDLQEEYKQEEYKKEYQEEPQEEYQEEYQEQPAEQFQEEVFRQNLVSASWPAQESFATPVQAGAPLVEYSPQPYSYPMAQLSYPAMYGPPAMPQQRWLFVEPACLTPQQFSILNAIQLPAEFLEPVNALQRQARVVDEMVQQHFRNAGLNRFFQPQPQAVVSQTAGQPSSFSVSSPLALEVKAASFDQSSPSSEETKLQQKVRELTDDNRSKDGTIKLLTQQNQELLRKQEEFVERIRQLEEASRAAAAAPPPSPCPAPTVRWSDLVDDNKVTAMTTRPLTRTLSNR